MVELGEFDIVVSCTEENVSRGHGQDVQKGNDMWSRKENIAGGIDCSAIGCVRDWRGGIRREGLGIDAERT